MEHMDMIDKLKEKAGITREEAADALTRANWDMLEALVILEREGVIAPLTSSVVTSSGTQNGYGYRTSGVRGSAPGESLGDKIKNLARNSLVYSFMVRREGKVIISLPVLLFIIILLAAFRITAAALLIGLFCGCRYNLEKRDGDNEDGNGGV